MRCMLSEPGCRILAPDGGVCPLPWSSSSRCSRASTRFLSPAPRKPPQALQETGLYSDFAALEVDPRHLAFSPQYPLWTDGAAKRRWISLPPGSAIDGSDPDAWVFPVGTRLWKEFSFGGRRVETRFIELQPDGQWLYAAYAWNPEGTDAQLVSERGRRGAYPLGGGRSHTIPGVSDCKACHQGGRSEVLGFSALQLSPDRDPGALHADAAGVDLAYLVKKGLITGSPKSLLDKAPRIAPASDTSTATAATVTTRKGRCRTSGFSCARPPARAFRPRLQAPLVSPCGSRRRPEAVLRIEPGHPERSGIMQRIASRYPALQMPPLGTALTDEEAIALIERWIAQTETVRKEAQLQQKEP